MSRGTSGADLGVYVHVPFCEHVCPYCDFAVVAVGRLGAPDEDAWVELVLARVGSAGARPLAGRRGRQRVLRRRHAVARAPRSRSSACWRRSAAALRFDAPEITVELNPGQLEVARVPELRALGVNRLSIGLQSTDDTVLRRLGRAHRADEALRGLDVCLAAGFDSLSVDLIYGAPGQTTELAAARRRARDRARRAARLGLRAHARARDPVRARGSPPASSSCPTRTPSSR